MIYLDNAATTRTKPPAVVQAVAQALCSAGNAGRGGHEAALDAARIIYDTRVRLAALFHTEDPGRIAFTQNSTVALNMAIKGTLKAGDHVITTSSEHNSVLRPLYEMETQGVELTILPADREGKIRYGDFEEAIRENTKAIVCQHGSNLTGNLLDIKRIGAIAKAYGLLFIVDASQTAGVFPIHVQEMKIDILCFTGHKALLGPQGTGGLYVREGVLIRPLVTGGSGIRTFDKKHPDVMPTALEAGTLNTHGLAGLRAALRYLEETGIDVIRKKEQELMWYFYERVKQIPQITIYGDFSARERCAIVALNLGDHDSARVSDVLQEEYGISTRPGGHCAPLLHKALGTEAQGAVRFSFSHYNTKEEIDCVLGALETLAKDE